ncbi:MAG TPA: tyrosine-type recombinase/integrase [Chloroflexota bacterium]|nr:tyrosine-type recombinase/integrase [Chloroflexota bacterium]
MSNSTTSSDGGGALVPRAAFLHSLELGAAPPRERNPITSYLTSLGRGGRPTQLSALRRIAAFFWGEAARAHLERAPWHEVRYLHMQAFRTWMIDGGAAPETTRRHLSALRRVLRECLRLGLMNYDDFQRAIDVPPVRGSRVERGRELSHGELRALFAAARAQRGDEGPRNAAVLALLYGAGLRRAEVVSLNLENVAADVTSVRVIGKGNKERIVPLPVGARAALVAYLDVRGREPGALFHPTRWGHELKRSRRLTDDAIASLLEVLAATAGVARFTAHDLRRTFVGDLLDAGADLATVQKMAGHCKPETTARYDRRGYRTRVRAAAMLAVPYGDDEHPPQ